LHCNGATRLVTHNPWLLLPESVSMPEIDWNRSNNIHWPSVSCSQSDGGFFFDTRATVSFIRTALSSLDTKMMALDSDISKFNEYVKTQLIPFVCIHACRLALEWIVLPAALPSSFLSLLYLHVVPSHPPLSPYLGYPSFFLSFSFLHLSLFLVDNYFPWTILLLSQPSSLLIRNKC
jgi:hypothetical protein